MDTRTHTRHTPHATSHKPHAHTHTDTHTCARGARVPCAVGFVERASKAKQIQMLDPYALLGVTTESTPEEARRAFSRLARLVHPDKGGAASDMIAVHQAYKYVHAQVCAVNRTTTLEDLERAFADFCSAQEAELPRFRDCCVDGDGDGADAHACRADYERARREAWAVGFNAAFEADQTARPLSMPAAIQGGYGSFMAAREDPGARYSPLPVSTAAEEEEDAQALAPLPLAVYAEPGAITASSACAACRGLAAGLDIPTPQRLDDYGLAGMSDYAQAHAELQPPPAPPPGHRPQTLEELVAQRASAFASDLQIKCNVVLPGIKDVGFATA